MSLELALKENTDTMKLLIAAWNQLTANATAINPAEPFAAGGVPITPMVKVPSKESEQRTAIAEAQAKIDASRMKHNTSGQPEEATPDPKAAAVSQPTETAAATPASSPAASSPAPSAVTYEDVKTLVLKVSKDKGRDAAAGVLAGFGVAKAPELKPEQYAKAVAQLKAVLA